MIQLGCILEDYSDLAEIQWCIQYCSRNCFSRSVSGKQKADVSGTQARNSERIRIGIQTNGSLYYTKISRNHFDTKLYFFRSDIFNT